MFILTYLGCYTRVSSLNDWMVLMSLRHALLALLDVGPMTGYDLARVFSDSVKFAWRANHSQIYPELRTMEKEGFIVANEVERGSRATKREYTITDLGREELVRWAEEPFPPQAERSVAHLHAMYLEYASFDTARRQFREHRDHYAALRLGWVRHAEALRNRDTNLMRLRLAAKPAPTHDAIVAYKAHVYDGLIARADVEIEWAEKGLSLVEELAAAREGSQPTRDRASSSLRPPTGR